MAVTKTGRVRGNKEILRNLRREVKLIDGDITSGLRVAAAFILGEAKAITPVQFGVLINSGFSGIGRSGRKILARVGFTASYAPFVHEMPSGTSFGKPQAERKFLERAVIRNTREILSIIKRKAKR